MKTEKLNATQRLEALEKAFANLSAKLEQQFAIVADELNRQNEISTALAKRLNAIVKAGDNGGVSTEAVKDAIVSEAAKELKAKVDFLVEQGLLVLNNDKAIDENTFFVGREVDFEGNEVNPRTQMLVSSLQKEAQERLIGKKVGDEVKDETIKQTLLITEIYEVKRPQVESEENIQQTEEAAGAEVIRTKAKKNSKK